MEVVFQVLKDQLVKDEDELDFYDIVYSTMVWVPVYEPVKKFEDWSDLTMNAIANSENLRHINVSCERTIRNFRIMQTHRKRCAEINHELSMYQHCLLLTKDMKQSKPAMAFGSE